MRLGTRLSRRISLQNSCEGAYMQSPASCNRVFFRLTQTDTLPGSLQPSRDRKNTQKTHRDLRTKHVRPRKWKPGHREKQHCTRSTYIPGMIMLQIIAYKPQPPSRRWPWPEAKLSRDALLTHAPQSSVGWRIDKPFLACLKHTAIV